MMCLDRKSWNSLAKESRQCVSKHVDLHYWYALQHAANQFMQLQKELEQPWTSIEEIKCRNMSTFIIGTSYDVQLAQSCKHDDTSRY